MIGKIFKIIDFSDADDSYDTAKEIDKLTKDRYMEFIQWAIVYYSTDGIGFCYFDDDIHDWISITKEEAFNYWKENIDK